MERVALYTRVSSEEQVLRGYSLGEQKQSLERYAKEHNMKIVEEYEDGGKSARKRYTTRPEFMRLLEDVKAEKFDTILFIKLDRWFRNIADYYEVQKILEEHNVRWRATQEDYETVTASGRLKVNIMLSVNQDEADRTSERIKFIFEGKKERNETVTGSVPIGYKIEDKKVVLDPETAPLVRKAYQIYFETGSTSRAHKESGLKISVSAMRRLLWNEAYLGKWAGIEIPPLITEAEHERALKLRKNPVRKTYENRTYLFSGLVFCRECGRRLVGRTRVYDTGNTFVYYLCDAKYRFNDCTLRGDYAERDIEANLLANIDAKIEARSKGEHMQKLANHKAEREAVKKKLSRLSELYVDDLIGINDYKRQYTELLEKLESIPPDEIPRSVEELKEQFSGDWKAIYAELPRKDKAAFWHKAIKEITFDENEKMIFTLR